MATPSPDPINFSLWTAVVRTALAAWNAVARPLKRWRDGLSFHPQFSTTDIECHEERNVVITSQQGQRTTKATYLRLRLFAGRDERCLVNVKRVIFKRTELVCDPSPLEWTHVTGFEPRRVRDERDEGPYVDLASALDGKWELRTQRSRHRGEWFREPGIYTIEFEIEAVDLRVRRPHTLSIDFDGTQVGFKLYEGYRSSATTSARLQT